ncbi:MAG: alpha/beta hydrolase-fold protein [Pseudomonadota bacterium]
MNIEYHKWYSQNLNQDMELKVYGHAGKPAIVFPAMGGRFYEFEDFKMIEAVNSFIEAGKIQFFTVDSVDLQSWCNHEIHPQERGFRHEAYNRYITQEVLPFIRNRIDSNVKCLTTGCSMGGYHSGNFFFRHPDLFDCLISLSGVFSLKMFVGDYLDDNVYYNSPLLYLKNLSDNWYLDRYKKSKIIICVGQGPWEDEMLDDIKPLEGILKAKSIPAWIDYWGNDVNHDWVWWRKQLPYFLGKLDL